ncbi:MAG: IPT/TIG domain-containing protein [Candidatus Sericytochromatia bacterium]
MNRLELKLAKRFLSFRGESIKIEVLAFDAAGNPVDPGTLDFNSSRPQDFSVDAAGLVKALVDDGFAEIRVSLGDVSAVVLVSVASQITGGTGGGGGGGSVPPQENVRGTVGFSYSNAPVLTGLSAGYGPAESQITLSGSGFSPTAEFDKVLIGDSPAEIVGTPTADSITVEVPEGALGPQDVSVTVGGQTSNLLSFRRNIGEFQVNDFSNFNSNITLRRTAVALDAEGDFVVSWASLDAGGDYYDVKFQRYDSAGTALGNESLANTFTTARQATPALAMDADGDFVIAWHGYGQDDSNYGIYAQRFNAVGVPQGSEFRVNTYTSTPQEKPVVAMDSGGDFVITWQSREQDGDSSGIFAQRFNAAGSALGSEFRVNTNTTNLQTNPSVALDDAGDFVISWESRALEGDYYDVQAQRYNSAGEPQGSEFRVNSNQSDSQRFASVGMDADGDFVVAWSSQLQDGSNSGIYAQRYNSAGLAQGNEFQVNSYTTSNQTFPTVSVAADGAFVIAWESNGQDGNGKGIYAQRFDSHGLIVGCEFQVNSYTNSTQNLPAAALADSGAFVIIWHSDGQNGFLTGVYAQRYAADGEAQ